MRSKLATILAAAFVCVGGAFGAVAVMSPVASASTDLCEYECGGKWGAREHAKAFAEQHGLTKVVVEGCKLNKEYGAQWVCWGYGTEPFLGVIFHFHVWMDEYGYEKHWELK